MSEETIITLNNGNSYKILIESSLEDKKYCLTVLLNESEEETDTYQVFEILNKDGNEVMRMIQDKTILEQLVVLFATKYSQITDSLGGTN